MTTIKEMKSLSEAATAGPWNAEIDIERKYFQIADDMDAICANTFCYADFNQSDAAFIAASRTFLPEAIRVMELMAEALNRARSRCIGFDELDAVIAEYNKLKGE